MQKILFIGASGMLGQPVALELIRAGFQLTLLARDVEKLEKLFPKIPVVKGDVFDRASLEDAMKGQEMAAVGRHRPAHAIVRIQILAPSAAFQRCVR